MANKLYEENHVQAVANAIRSKNGSTDRYVLADMPDAIRSIQTGTDTSDANATADNIEYPKTAYINGQKVTGSLIKTYDIDDRAAFNILDFTQSTENVFARFQPSLKSVVYPTDIYSITISKDRLSEFVSPWNKVHSSIISVDTSSTTLAEVKTISIPDLYTAERVLVRITDENGKRSGRFYAHEDWFRNYWYEDGNDAMVLSIAARLGLYVDEDGELNGYVGTNTTAYGVYAYRIYPGGGTNGADRLQIYSRYNANYSKTINSRYRIEVYTFSMPTE